MLSWIAKAWCVLREKHHYENDGSPVPIPASNTEIAGEYFQVRRCPNCGDTYDTFAGFIRDDAEIAREADNPEARGVLQTSIPTRGEARLGNAQPGDRPSDHVGSLAP